MKYNLLRLLHSKSLSRLNHLLTRFYYTSNGMKMIYQNFKEGEPNNYGGIEDCVHKRKYDSKWNDNVCSSKLDFICQY